MGVVREYEWAPPPTWRRVLAIDAHAAGEPLRVILDGFPPLEARTALDLRREAAEHHDALRRALMWEPRGHADMYGCLVLPPVSPRGDVTVLFMHNDGFSTMCGHGIIAVTTVLLECGVFVAREPESLLRIDTPAGYIEAWAQVRGKRVQEVAFTNVPSFAARLDATVDVPDVGTVRYDMAYGGAFYAYVCAADFGLSLVPEEHARLVDLGRRIKRAVQADAPPVHPAHADLGFVYGTIFTGNAQAAGAHSRNVCVFADGEIDRSPTGTGVSGRAAIHHARGELAAGERIEIESILGTRFGVRISGTTVVGQHDAVVPEVSGSAHVVGRQELLVDPDDPLAAGFFLR